MDPTILRVIGPGFLNQVPTLWCVELAQGSLFGFWRVGRQGSLRKEAYVP